MPDRSSTERRAFERAPIQAEWAVWLCGQDDAAQAFLPARAWNVSTGGAMISLASACSTGQTFLLRVPTAGVPPSLELPETLEGVGRVEWTRPGSAGEMLAGVAFDAPFRSGMELSLYVAVALGEADDSHAA